MPQRVATRLLWYAARTECLLERALHHRLVHVVAAALTGLGILIHPPRRKDPLPPPLSARIRVLQTERTGQRHPTRSSRDVALVLHPHLGRCFNNRLFNRSGNIVRRSRSPFPPRTVISLAPKSMSLTRRRSPSSSRIPVP